MLRKTFTAGLLLTRVWVAGAADFPYYYQLEPPAEERYGGDEAVTGGGYATLSAKEFPGSVRILDGETLRNRGYLWLGQALAEEADIYVEYVPGREGPAIMPRFRGSSSREVLLLIDGVPANDLATGRADLKLIPIEAVARVEVFRGPMSYRFGDGAVAGVVNVVTLSGPREAARALISASDGTFDTERYRFNFGMTARGFDMYASGNRILTMEPNAWERNASSNVDARVARRWGNGAVVDLSYGHFAGSENVLHPRDWGENVLYNAPALQDNSHDHVRAAARRRWGAGNLRAEGYFAQTTVRFVDGLTGRTYQGRAREESGKVSYAVPHGGGGSFSVGAGGALREYVHTGDKAGVLSASVLEEMRPGESFYLAAGAAYDAMPGVGGALSPRLAATALLGGGFKVYGSFGGGARLPAAAELGRREEVTRELGYEAGVRYYRKGVAEVGAAYFYSRGNDVYLDGERYWTGELVRRGVDVSAEGALPPWFDWGASYCLTDARREDDERAGFVPEHRAFGKFGWRKSFLRDDLALRGEVRCEYTGVRPAVYPAAGGEAAVPSPYFKVPYRRELPAYWQLGAHVGVAVVSFQVYCNVENINRSPDYVIAPGYSLPRKMRTYIGFNWTLFD
jgi:outer membrane receptor protein involved in Fe transport